MAKAKQYLFRLPYKNYQLNLIEWHQEARLVVLVRETYVFCVYFETAKLQKFFILKKVPREENKKDSSWKAFICVQKMCLIISIVMYLLRHWSQLVYDTLYSL